MRQRNNLEDHKLALFVMSESAVVDIVNEYVKEKPCMTNVKNIEEEE